MKIYKATKYLIDKIDILSKLRTYINPNLLIFPRLVSFVLSFREHISLIAGVIVEHWSGKNLPLHVDNLVHF